MQKPVVIYTDHIMNKTLCYNFAKGSDSLLCHVKNFKDYNKTIATYGVLRGTLDVIRKVKNCQNIIGFGELFTWELYIYFL